MKIAPRRSDFELLNHNSARLSERLGLRDRHGARPGTGARGVCHIRRRARGGSTGAIGAFERPRDYEMMVTATDVRRNEVETVCGQSAFDKINTAIVIGAAASDGIENIAAELAR